VTNRPKGAAEFFSPDYRTARNRFREGVEACGGRNDPLPIAAPGPAGEQLAIDIGWFGATNPRQVLMHSSGVHGVEGFAGSAIQLQWLREGIPRLAPEAALVMVHAINPYGMAWLRRFNENNVDLNRNFRTPCDADDAIEYLKLDAFVNPQSAPRPDLFYVRAAGLVLRHGLPSLRQAIQGGQRILPRGLFYGGTEPEEGVLKFAEYLQSRLTGAERIVGIDVHTGLGRYGDDRLLVDGDPEREQARLSIRKVFGERVQEISGEGISANVAGQHELFYRLFPRAQVYFTTQEFGTFHGIRVLAALRDENRWHHFGSGGVDHWSKKQLLHAFSPRDPAWQQKVLLRGSEVVGQASLFALGDL
jgi:hypothetical protein